MPPKKGASVPTSSGEELDAASSRTEQFLICFMANAFATGAPYLPIITRYMTLVKGEEQNYNSMKSALRPYLVKAKALCEKDTEKNGDKAGETTTKATSRKRGPKKTGDDVDKVKTGRVTKSSPKKKKVATPESDEENESPETPIKAEAEADEEVDAEDAEMLM